MILNSLIEKAALEALESPQMENAARGLGITVEELCDLVARTIAEGYLDGSVAWQYGDRVMNSLYAWAYGPSDVCLSEFAWDVFTAFDEGEYKHHGDPPGVGSDAHTMPLIKKVLGVANA